jgi:hypothetical protein
LPSWVASPPPDVDVRKLREQGGTFVRLVKCLMLIPLVSFGVCVSQSAPGFSAPAITINGKSGPVPNLKAGQVVKVAAGAGSFGAGHTIVITECNAATDTSGSACDTTGYAVATANADGSVSPTSYTLKAGALGTDTSHTCLPPSSTDIKAGISCLMAAADLNNTSLNASDPFFDKPAIKASLSSGTVTVTCKKIANLNNGTTTTFEKVLFKKNGTTVTSKTNSTGTVKASFAAATGDKIQCVGQTFGQKSKVVTL